jgi:hypothetical protein
MPRYVIHIGPPKAGSKYLQSSLINLRKQLARRKISYPTTLMPRPPSHAALDLLRSGNRSPVLERAFSELNAAGHDVIVLSWEGACNLPEPALACLRDLIGSRNEVKIVYYCRSFAERVPSLWKQQIKAGRSVTLPEFCDRVCRTPIRGHEFNPSLLWKRWSTVFGRESLHLVSFNNLRDHKVDLFDHFAATFLGWAGVAQPKRRNLHESPDAADTEMGRALNALHLANIGKDAENSRGGLFFTYMRLKPQLEFGPILEAMQHDTRTMTFDDNATAFLPVYDALMAFKDRLTNQEYGTEMFSRGVNEVSYVRQDYLLQPGVVPALQDIYRIVHAAPVSGGENRRIDGASLLRA